jgi:hypothetical protein
VDKHGRALKADTSAAAPLLLGPERFIPSG